MPELEMLQLIENEIERSLQMLELIRDLFTWNLWDSLGGLVLAVSHVALWVKVLRDD